jgi:hypothetical protein
MSPVCPGEWPQSPVASVHLHELFLLGVACSLDFQTLCPLPGFCVTCTRSFCLGFSIDQITRSWAKVTASCRALWFTPVIPATQEAEIRRIVVQSQVRVKN